MIWKYDNVDIKIKVLSEESFSGNYGLGFELKMKGELVSQTIISSLHILVDLVNTKSMFNKIPINFNPKSTSPCGCHHF